MSGKKEDLLPAVLELVYVPLSSQNTLFFAEIVESDDEHPRPGVGLSTCSAGRSDAVCYVEDRRGGEKVSPQDFHEKVSHERDQICLFHFLWNPDYTQIIAPGVRFQILHLGFQLRVV